MRGAGCWQRTRAASRTPTRADVPIRTCARARRSCFPRDDGAIPHFAPSGGTSPAGCATRRRASSASRSRSSASAPASPKRATSRFAPRQLLFAHAALADPAMAAAALRPARGARGLRTRRRIGRRRPTCASTTGRSCSEGDALSPRTSARAHSRSISTFDARAPPLLQGDRGVSRKGPDPREASYYYSRPQLAVSGNVTFDDATRDVTGIAWLDHEWSSDYLPRGARRLGLDRHQLRRRRRADGVSHPRCARRRALGRRRVSRRGTAQHARSRPPTSISFAQRRWRSPRTGDRVSGLVPRPRRGHRRYRSSRCSTTRSSTRARASAPCTGKAPRASIGGRAVGRGYLELTGYGEPLRI